jgi:hypothetical protein
MDDSLTFAQVHLRAPNTLKFCQSIGYSLDAVLTGHSADFEFCFCHDVIPLLRQRTLWG